MRKTILTLIFTFCLFISFPAIANTITKLKKGQVSPYSGFLQTTEAQMKLKIKPKHQKEMNDLKMKHKKQFADERVKNQKKVHQIEVNAQKNKYKSIINIQKEEIERQRRMTQKPSGPNQVPLWITIGVLGGAAMTVAVVYALQPTR